MTARKMNRQEAEHLINNVFWPIEDEIGFEMLLTILEELGLSALTDEAVILLAQRQKLRDEQEALRFERKMR